MIEVIQTAPTMEERDADGRDPIVVQLTKYFEEGAKNFMEYLMANDRSAVPTVKSVIKRIFDNIINPKIFYINSNDSYYDLYDTSDIDVRTSSIHYGFEQQELVVVTLHKKSSDGNKYGYITGYIILPAKSRRADWRLLSLDDRFDESSADLLILDCEKYMRSLVMLDIPADLSFKDLIYVSGNWAIPIVKFNPSLMSENN